MSATGRGHVREAHDEYNTPGWAVRAVLPKLLWHRDMVVLEPGCGRGAVIHELLRAGVAPGAIVATDIQATHVAAARSMGVAAVESDFVASGAPPPPDGAAHYDLVIGNPPYSHAEAFARRAREAAGAGGAVALLLRLGFLAGQARSGWLRADVPDVYVLARRPSFVAGGSDSSDYAWLVWGGPPRTRGDVSILRCEAARGGLTP